MRNSATAAASSELFGDGTARVSLHLIEQLGAAHAERLDFFRSLALKGRESEAEGELRALLSSEAWDLLPSKYRARGFILLASLALSRRGDLDEAGRLLSAAKTEDPSGRFVALEAHLRQARDGVEAALGALPEPVDIQEWHTRIVLLLNSNLVPSSANCAKTRGLSSRLRLNLGGPDAVGKPIGTLAAAIAKKLD